MRSRGVRQEIFDSEWRMSRNIRAILRTFDQPSRTVTSRSIVAGSRE